MELGAGNLSRNFPHFCLDCVAGAGAETSALSFSSAPRAFFRQTWRWFSTTSTSRLANVDELQPVFRQRRLSILLVFIELSSPQAINHNSGFRPSVTQSSHPTGTLVVRGSRVKKEVHASLRHTNGSQHCMFPKTGSCLFPANQPCLCFCAGSRPLREPRLLGSMVRWAFPDPC